MSTPSSSLLESAAFLYDFSLSSLGPHGHTKLCHRHPRATTVSLTTHSRRLYDSDSLTNVSGVHRVLLSSVSSLYDCGHYHTVILTSLLKQCERHWQYPYHLVAHYQQRTVAMIASVIESASVTVSLHDWHTVLALLVSSLSSKPIVSFALSHTDKQRLASLVFQSFLTVMGQCQSVGEVLKRVRVQLMVGHDVGIMKLLHGVLLDNVPLPIVAGKNGSGGVEYRDLKVLVYDISLAFTDDELKALATIDTTDSAASITARHAIIDRLVECWLSVGITALLCQKVIHGRIKHALSQRGVVCLDRLSVRHLTAVQSLAQCPIISSIDTVTIADSNTGTIGSMKAIKINSKRILFVGENDRQRRGLSGVCTVVLGGSTPNECQELEHCVRSAIATLAESVYQNGNGGPSMSVSVCEGGGALERRVSQHLRQLATSIQQQHRYTCTNTDNDSSSRIAVIRARRRAQFHRLERDILTDLSDTFLALANAVSISDTDIDTDSQSDTSLPVSEWRVLDCSLLKRRAIVAAAEVAGVAMRIEREINQLPVTTAGDAEQAADDYCQ